MRTPRPRSVGLEKTRPYVWSWNIFSMGIQRRIASTLAILSQRMSTILCMIQGSLCHGPCQTLTFRASSVPDCLISRYEMPHSPCGSSLITTRNGTCLDGVSVQSFLSAYVNSDPEDIESMLVAVGETRCKLRGTMSATIPHVTRLLIEGDVY